ncbi:MAG: hypothetical protein J0H49_32615 [Acidobacteria bacterium]|nr:hypothetical protein [Acidobacteriota bacterium]
MPLPPFIELGAPQTFAAPYDMQQCRCYGFMLQADIGALHRFCDSYLNAVAPEGSTERYRPAMDRVMFVYSDMGRALIGARSGYRQFTVPEIDVAFWIPVVAVRQSAGRQSISRFLWLMTYVNVDNLWAVASGREIYGFPKGLANVHSAAGPGALDLLTVDTLAVERFGPEAAARIQPFLELRKTGPGANALTRVWNSAGEAMAELTSFFSVARPGSGLAAQFAELIRHRRYPMVFLKQFRDVVDPTRACYQAVVEADVTLGAFRGAGLLAGDYRLEISSLESHPVVEELGLESHAPRVLNAFHSDFDFQMGLGRVIWERR